MKEDLEHAIEQDKISLISCSDTWLIVRGVLSWADTDKKNKDQADRAALSPLKLWFIR